MTDGALYAPIVEMVMLTTFVVPPWLKILVSRAAELSRLRGDRRWILARLESH